LSRASDLPAPSSATTRSPPTRSPLTINALAPTGSVLDELNGVAAEVVVLPAE
jgi:hypothetical protein